MTNCSAPNCSNSSRKGFRLFRFPRDKERCKRWVTNCRRDRWEPTDASRLCEIHFEETQFEMNRQDGWKKLKFNAIPTIFSVPNPPKRIGRRRMKEVSASKVNTPSAVRKSEKNTDADNSDSAVNEELLKLKSENGEMKRKISALQLQNERLQKSLDELNSGLQEFLLPEQINVLGRRKQEISKWSHDGIARALKLRFALGRHGYNYLRSTGYPTPSYSTLCKHIHDVKESFGLLHPGSTITVTTCTIESEPDDDDLEEIITGNTMTDDHDQSP